MANDIEPEMKIKAVAPWFGSKRTLAPEIVRLLGPHLYYFEGCCGSLAVLFAKKPSRHETVCDLHGDVINLALVIQSDDAPVLYERLSRTLFSDEVLEAAQRWLSGKALYGESVPKMDMGYRLNPVCLERAYWYFVASWMGRNGCAGMDRTNYHLCIRWNAGGGSPTTRFRSAVESIPAWHQRLRNVVITRRDVFDSLDRLDDSEGMAIYVDPPYTKESRSHGNYLHDFQNESNLFATDDHSRLASALNRFQRAKVIVSYYDCPRVRRLYDGWHFTEFTGLRKNLINANGRSLEDVDAPEVLICNRNERGSE